MIFESRQEVPLAVGLDAGGTYTDAVLVEMNGGRVVKTAKHPTTHHRLRLAFSERNPGQVFGTPLQKRIARKPVRKRFSWVKPCPPDYRKVDMPMASKRRIRLGLFFTGTALLTLFAAGCGHSPGSGARPFSGLIGFYRGPLNHLSAVRRGRCSMYPSCSQYGLQALAKHGELIGWVMACDRLLRCGRDTIHRVPQVRVGDAILFFDPLKNNDFWWAAPRPDLPPPPELPASSPLRSASDGGWEYLHPGGTDIAVGGGFRLR